MLEPEAARSDATTLGALDPASAAVRAAGVVRLELRGVSKSFGSVQALTDVDFEVRPGEVMALVGDNGAGKSTLIKIITGVHRPDSGEIFFGGKRIEGLTVEVHGRIVPGGV